MSDEKFWVWITGILCTAIVVLLLGVYYYSNVRMEIFVKHGYTRQTLVGYAHPQWVKETGK